MDKKYKELRRRRGEEVEAKDEVKEMVALYAKVWDEILENKTFLRLAFREQGSAAEGVFRELLKNRRAERIYELHEELKTKQEEKENGKNRKN